MISSVLSRCLFPAIAVALIQGAIPLWAGDNILQNGDFSEPINIDRKRGRWMLLIAQAGGSNFTLVPEGFSVENNTLAVEMPKLKSNDGSSAYVIQFSQLIPPLLAGKRYKLSFEAKATEEGQILVGAGIVLAGLMEGGLAWQTERPGSEWREYTHEFTAADVPDGKPTTTRLDFRLGKANGVLSFRNIRLEELD